MESNNLDIMSHDEECCLKTALAFAVLRKRLQNDDTQPAPAFLRGLLNSDISTLAPVDPANHLQNMMNVAIETATSMCHDNKNNNTTSSRATLEGICKHLALQLCNHDSVSLQWIQETISSKDTIVAVWLVWHCILQVEARIGGKLLLAIGQVLQHLYHSTEKQNALHMVKLVELAEVCISIRLSNTPLQELLEEYRQAFGPHLLLPVATKDLAYFVLRNNEPGNKLLLRFCLYDVLEKLSACTSH